MGNKVLSLKEPLLAQRVLASVITAISFGLFIVVNGEVSRDYPIIYSLVTGLGISIGLLAVKVNKIGLKKLVLIGRLIATPALMIMWFTDNLICYFITDEIILSVYWLLLAQVGSVVTEVLMRKYNVDIRELNAYTSTISTYGKLAGLLLLIFIVRDIQSLTIAMTVLIIYFEICNEWLLVRYNDAIIKMDKERK